MELDQMKSRQQAILDELFYASQMSEEEYVKSKWSIEGTAAKLYKEYRELERRIKGFPHKT